MATLEEIIKQRLADAEKTITEAKKVELKDPDDEEGKKTDEIDTEPKLKKPLCKESLDEMTEDEFNKLVENIEQLDEVSKETLKSYIKKAHPEYEAKGTLSDRHQEIADKKFKKFDKTGDEKNLEKSSEHQDKAYEYGASANKRAKGIDAASRKLKESQTSEQVSALLEAEGLSDEFKTQAVTIFEAAVTDRVLDIESTLKEEFDSQLAEAKEELENDIDGFLSEAIQQWKADNEVAIKANFKSQLAESFMDGLFALIAEHNIELPEEKEDALKTALESVDTLKESIEAVEAEKQSLVEEINQLKAEKILESFKEKMTQTEFDRFTQLTESIKYQDATQYEKQLKIVQENFGANKKQVTQITEEVIVDVPVVNTIVTESDSNVSKYASFLSKKK